MIKICGSCSTIAGQRSRHFTPGFRRAKTAREIHLLTGMYPIDIVGIGEAAATRAFGQFDGVRIRVSNEDR